VSTEALPLMQISNRPAKEPIYDPWKYQRGSMIQTIDGDFISCIVNPNYKRVKFSFWVNVFPLQGDTISTRLIGLMSDFKCRTICSALLV